LQTTVGLNKVKSEFFGCELMHEVEEEKKGMVAHLVVIAGQSDIYAAAIPNKARAYEHFKEELEQVIHKSPQKEEVLERPLERGITQREVSESSDKSDYESLGEGERLFRLEEDECIVSAIRNVNDKALILLTQSIKDPSNTESPE
jgi:hypothetical protein